MPRRVGAVDELVEVRVGPVLGRDPGVVADVVAEVGERRCVDRSQPDRVDPEPLQVVEAARDPRQIADPVAVGVLEGARVDLVDHGLFPPGAHRPQSVVAPESE